MAYGRNRKAPLTALCRRGTRFEAGPQEPRYHPENLGAMSCLPCGAGVSSP